MDAGSVLQELESMGTEQNRKTYRRHGVADEIYGVSYANLGKLKKRIKVDHDLAMALWESGNHDARILATMVADPMRADEAMLDAWAHDLTDPVTADAVADLAARSGLAQPMAERWMASEDEWIGRAGWHTLARLAGRPDSPPDSYFEGYITTIERDLHTRKNRVREAMNSALIAIGVRGGLLEQKALDAAAAIGTVEIDHGETYCKTPDAADYIRKTLQRRQAKRPAPAQA
ncbi:MAG: DNA alkylation repair protein [Dehalococcoidia bacterium]